MMRKPSQTGLACVALLLVACGSNETTISQRGASSTPAEGTTQVAVPRPRSAQVVVQSGGDQIILGVPAAHTGAVSVPNVEPARAASAPPPPRPVTRQVLVQQADPTAAPDNAILDAGDGRRVQIGTDGRITLDAGDGRRLDIE